MASKISINLDTSKENYISTKCKQNDDLKLEAFIYENGSILDLTNKEISIQALKADNTYIIQNTNIVKDKNKILAELDRDFSRVPGTTKIEIVLTESSKKNTTFSFCLEVIGSVIKGAVQSSDAITALEEVQAAVTEIGRINEETQTLVNNAGAASKEDFNKVNASLEQSTFLLENKKVVAYGTSITWGQKAPAGVRSEHPWTKIFQEITKCNMDNRAMAGTCMAIGNGYGITEELNTNAFCNRVDREDFSNIDFLFLEYGTNDYGYVIELGNINDNQKTTFYGALNYSVEKLLNVNPKMKIILLTPMYANTTNVKNQKYYTMYDYVSAVKNIANKFNLPCINLHEEMGINKYNLSFMYWDELHPSDKTYIEMGEFIAKQYPFTSTANSREIKALLPLISPNNMIKHGDFAITGHRNLFDDFTLEGGISFKLLPSAVKETIVGYKLKPNKEYTITFSARTLSNSELIPQQKVQIDFFNTAIACYKIVGINSGESKYIAKIKTPSNIETNKLYKLRFSGLETNVDTLYISAVMLVCGDVGYDYSPASGESFDKRWNSFTLVTGSSQNNTLAYYKDAEGFVHFRGLVTLTGETLFANIPQEFRPKYAITTPIMANDGSITFCIINTDGNLSVGVGNKTYDLSSVNPFYAGEIERY